MESVLPSLPKSRLVDSHGRLIHKLRVQLTDSCNFRCFYCMPQAVKFLPTSHLMSSSELVEITSGLVELGIDEIRVSGGEPTLRSDFEEIIAGLSKLALRKLGLTTNGFILRDKLSFLKQTRCQHINISLDSLKENRFNVITRTNHFRTVLKSVNLTQEAGFRVKVNVVIMRGVNDDEVLDFVDFSAKNNIEVRFLELMKIGPYYSQHSRLFVSAREMIKKIEERESLTPQSMNCDSTSFNFKTSSGAHVGFIASESQSFCGFCSRLRLTATGFLRACLMLEAGINLRYIPKEKYGQVVEAVMGMKPIDRIDHIKQPMYQIGG